MPQSGLARFSGFYGRGRTSYLVENERYIELMVAPANQVAGSSNLSGRAI